MEENSMGIWESRAPTYLNSWIRSTPLL